ncbi:MAG: hypothetical protein HY235_20800 [Acidobacteria bacterium]|nr:hypothetical protein [Acidobacteriota bacterium]
MSTAEAMRPHLDRLQTRAFMVGVIGVAALGAGLVSNSEQFYRSYLMGFVYWMGVALGSLGLLMLHHMVGGNWGVAIRRGLEAGTRTLPLMVLLAIPVFLGAHSLYEWTHADVVENDPVLRHKSLYLNMTGFTLRAVFYFLIWFGLSTLLNRYSKAQESEGYWAVRPRLQRVSAPGLILHCLTVTFFAVDFVMSVEPHWFSTIYGAIFIAGQVLSTFAFMVVLMRSLTLREPMKNAVSAQTFHDLGNLMFAFNMFWAYVSFSQLLIIWSANFPEETIWYLKRTKGGWEYVGLSLFVFHFSLIFLLLLIRKFKRQPAILSKIAVWVILMRLVDLFWIIQPAFSHGSQGGVPAPQFHVHWLDIVAPVAIGGLWVAFFAFQLKKRPLDPLPLA